MTSKLALALDWLRSKAMFTAAKDLEAKRRSDLVAACFKSADGSAHLFRGMNTVDLEQGFRLKAQTKAEAKVIDRKKFDAALAKLLDLGESGRLLAGRLVRWEPVVSLKELEALEPNHRRLFNKAVEVKLSGPSLELVEPTQS